METNLDFLVLYTEIVMAFIAFATIIATLRQAFFGHLTQLQNLLVRFWVWIGFLNLAMAMLPLALFTLVEDELLIWRISNTTLLVLTAIFLPYYIHRRLKIKAKVPLISRLVMVGYGVGLLGLLITASEWFWPPSLATTTTFLMWGFISNVAVFIYFLGTYVDLEEDNSQQEQES